MRRLEGKRAVITGGSSGIGLEAARLFVQNGARVVLLGREKLRLAEAVAGIGSGASGLSVDVTDLDALGNAVRDASGRLGGIDILFANAGMSDLPPIAQTTEADFDRIMDLNVKGSIFSVVYARPLLLARASVILTGSVAARKGRPGDPIYAASKGAVRSFGRSLAVDEELLARQIRVNVVTPGATETPLTRLATQDPAIRKYVADMVPMGRWGLPREVAQVVLFLASDESSYVTGDEITVDGGLAHV
jgi:NAD(P)-dependent dehydrogenase (short-subunit alcohol dehydrogenase family)